MENTESKRTILSVENELGTGNYYINVTNGITLGELCFSIATVVKCLARDGIADKEEMLERIANYVNDVQYGEVEEE